MKDQTDETRAGRMAEWLAEMAALAPLPAPDTFLDEVRKLGIEFDPGDVDRLGRYAAMLLHVNRHMNLTAVADPEELWLRHVLDSLTLVPLVVSAEAATAVDIGSGGGLPGLVLAIVLPQVRFTLLEATGKKARFLKESACALGLANIAVINDRAESIGVDRFNHRGKYDLVTARAVGKLPVLLELAAPLATVGGHVLAIKGQQAGEEIRSAQTALRLLHCQVLDTVDTPTGKILVIQKLKATPRIYPRKAGEPKRAPLGGKTHAGADAGDCGDR